jgi:hypothetical protein
MNKLVETAVDSEKCPHCGLPMQTEEHDQTCVCLALQLIDHRVSEASSSADDWSDVT